MQVGVEQLAQVIKKNLSPVFLVSGDEPLQRGESVDLIRQQARDNGFINRIVLDVDARFDWAQLAVACLSQSLFAEKNLIELNLPSAKPGKEGSAAIVAVIEQLSSDNVLIIIAGKVDKSAKKTKWFKAVEANGVVMQVWPIEGRKLRDWLNQRLRQKKLTLEQGGVTLLLQRVEGNLLSAVQEIEKLHVLFGSSKLSLEQVESAIADNSRYDVFKLTDSMLEGDASRVVQILEGLRAEKIVVPVVLWALAREIRVLATLSVEKARSGRLEVVFQKYRIWDSKKSGYLKALARGNNRVWALLLQRCAKVDLMVKGLEKGSEWTSVEQIALAVCDPRWVKKAGLSIVL